MPRRNLQMAGGSTKSLEFAEFREPVFPHKRFAVVYEVLDAPFNPSFEIGRSG